MRLKLLTAYHPLLTVRAAELAILGLRRPLNTVRGRQVEECLAVQLTSTTRHRCRDNRVPAVSAHQHLHRIELGVHVGNHAAVLSHLRTVLLRQLWREEHPGNLLCHVLVLAPLTRCPLSCKGCWLLQFGLLVQSVGVEVHDCLGDVLVGHLTEHQQVVPAAVVRDEVQKCLGDNWIRLTEPTVQTLENSLLALAATDVASIEG